MLLFDGMDGLFDSRRMMGEIVINSGVADPTADLPIVTNMSNTIAFGNSGGDLHAVRLNWDGTTPLAPTPRSLEYNFIG